MTPPRLIIRPALVGFGQRLRAARHAAHLTQRELSERARVNRKYLSEVELGIANISLATMALLADGLRCELADLFPPGR